MKSLFFTTCIIFLVVFQISIVSTQTNSDFDYQAGTRFNYKISNIYDNSTTAIDHNPYSIPLLNNSQSATFENTKFSNHLFSENEILSANLKNNVNNSISRDEILICLVNFTSFPIKPVFMNTYYENDQSITYDFNSSDLLVPLMDHFPILYRSFQSKDDLEFFIQAYPHVTQHSEFNFSIESDYINFRHFSVTNLPSSSKLISNYNITYNWKTGLFTTYENYFYSKDNNGIVRIHKYNLNYIGLETTPDVSTHFYFPSLLIALPIVVILRKMISKKS